MLIGESRSTGSSVVNTTCLERQRRTSPFYCHYYGQSLGGGKKEKEKEKREQSSLWAREEEELVGRSGLFLPRQMPEGETGGKGVANDVCFRILLQLRQRRWPGRPAGNQESTRNAGSSRGGMPSMNGLG